MSVPHTQAEQREEDQSALDREQMLEAHRSFRWGLAYGRFVYRSRWFILILWLVILAASVPFASKLSSVLSGGGYSFNGSESVHVSNALIDRLHMSPSQITVVFQSASANVSDPAYQQEINDVTSKIRTFQHVTRITSGSAGQDGRTTFLVVSFDKGYDYMQQRVSNFRGLLPAGSATQPAKVYLSDQLAIVDEINTLSQSDTERADATVLPLALLVLLIVFGTLTAAIMPLVLALASIPVALALVYPIALNTSISSFVVSIASIIGLGISIDYSLFITRRFREELARGRDTREAIAWTVATAGEAILFSGLTVMIGFTGLMLIGIGVMTSEGLGGAATVAIAVIGALTLIPALLAILGPRINRLRLPWLWRLTMPDTRNASGANGNTAETGFWHRLAMGVMRRPVMVIVLVGVILLALGWPVLSLNIGTDGAAILPHTSEARQGLNILQAQYPTFIANPLDVTAQNNDGSNMLSPQNLNRVAALTQWLSKQPHVTGVISLTAPPTSPGSPAISQQQLFALYTSGSYAQIPALAQFVSSTTSGNFTSIVVNTDTKLDSDAGKALVDHLRANEKTAGNGLTVQVGGIQAVYLDFDRYLYGNFPRAILFILAATFVLLLLMFRSLLLPLKAILMNVLSISAAYGVLVFVFQWGNLANILGFTSSGFIDSLVPIILFCILFGLSMDYEVFLLSRIREEWLRTHNNTLAVARGLEKTGSVITNAALLFVIVTVAFTFTSLIVTKEMGVGMTIAVLVDASIIRSLLAPATMRLLGRWNWWLPGRPIPQEQREASS
jgi:putative drug exporter of the RND superfamily